MPINDDQFREYLKNPIMFPPAFKDWVADWYATNVPKLHVSQIFGFKLHSIHCADDVPAFEATASTAYGDLATPGPSLENLANGLYVVMWGAYASGATSAVNIYMSISADGDTPSGQREMVCQSSEMAFSAGRMALVDFTQGDHTHSLAAKYKYSGTSGFFQYRWLHALKVVTDDA